MGASQRIIQQLSDFESLRAFVELVNNPQGIKDAHELARKEMALTSAEGKKFDEARAFMATYEAKVAEINKANDALSNAQAAYQTNKSVTEKDLAEKKSQLEKLEAELTQVKIRHGEIEKQQTNKEAELNSAKSELLIAQKQHTENVQSFNINVENQKKELADLKAKLLEQDRDIKTRLAKVKLREQAADLA